MIGSSISTALITGYTTNDESRIPLGDLFPFVDILQDNTAYTSFGSEPFTVQNELYYHVPAADSFCVHHASQTYPWASRSQKYHSVT